MWSICTTCKRTFVRPASREFPRTADNRSAHWFPCWKAETCCCAPGDACTGHSLRTSGSAGSGPRKTKATSASTIPNSRPSVLKNKRTIRSSVPWKYSIGIWIKLRKSSQYLISQGMFDFQEPSSLDVVPRRLSTVSDLTLGHHELSVSLGFGLDICRASVGLKNNKKKRTPLNNNSLGWFEKFKKNVGKIDEIEGDLSGFPKKTTPRQKQRVSHLSVDVSIAGVAEARVLGEVPLDAQDFLSPVVGLHLR